MIYLAEIIFGIGLHQTWLRWSAIRKYNKAQRELEADKREIRDLSYKCFKARREYDIAMDEIEVEVLGKDLPLPDRIQINPYLQSILDLYNGHNPNDSDILSLLPEF